MQIGPDTLVVALLSGGDRALQAALLGDIAAKTPNLLVLDRADGAEALARAGAELDALEARLTADEPDKAAVIAAHRDILRDPAMARSGSRPSGRRRSGRS